MSRAEHVAMEWQSIDTAPKNGRRILAWSNEWGEPMSVHHSSRGWTPGYDLGPTKYQPTHWLPTPELPYSENMLKLLQYAREAMRVEPE